MPGLAAVLIYSIWMTSRLRRANAEQTAEVGVQRGEESWQWFVFCLGFPSLVVVEAFQMIEAWEGHKLFVTLIDLTVFVYLFLVNDWFRNLLIGLKVRIQNKVERT